MHLHWERSSNTAGDCIIRSLSWMGRVPDEIPQEEGWKLSRNHYYQEGWLSTANLRGVVGVTYTSSLCGEGEAQLLPPARTNYNLRGHRAEVTLVRWNEPYQKLASCDTSGIIFVWIKYEGRWSIELINDRNTPVICFSWSHDGRMALICYQDGFVLVGSVAGQRYWSTLLPADVNNITSGVWTPDDQHVYLGTSQGDIIAMDIDGNTVGRVTLQAGVTISELSWNCERFNMEEQPEQTPAQPSSSATSTSSKPPQQCLRSDGKPYVLAAALRNGDILLLRSYDDIIPQVIKTGFQNYCMDWTNSGNLLAVAGKSKEIACRKDHSIRYTNMVHFYNETGNLILKSKIPCETSPVTALTWGHNDKRLFIATGNQIHIGWISCQVASLQLLSRLKVHGSILNRKHVDDLPLPCRMQNLIGMLFTQTIRCSIPNPADLREFVLKPQPDSVRLHCTMIRHNDNSQNDNSNGNTASGNQSSSLNNPDSSSNNSSSSYTLYLEHLGGFLPLLKGKKISKIRPEFVIYDPQLSDDSSSNWLHFPSGNHLRRLNLSPASNSETETDEDIHSPRVRRRRRRRRGPLPRYGYIGSDNIDYMNILPEENRLAEVTSNIWGTKFKILGLNQDCLPSSLGQINYKASLLHLQPRQMRVEIVDLRDDESRDGSNGAVDWNGEDLLDDDWQSDDFESQDYSSAAAAAFGSDDEDDQGSGGVTMKDDILTAVTTELHIAPIAPLPSRLSFCIGPRQPQTQNATPFDTKVASLESSSTRTKAAYDNELYISNAIVHEIRMLNEESEEIETGNDIITLSPCKRAQIEAIPTTTTSSTSSPLSTALTSIRSPTCTSSRKMVKGDGTLVEGTTATTIPESPACHKVKITDSLVQFCESPLKQRRLRVSVSCDNYLSDAKFALSRRDSVGSGSPHSSKGSPLRWATKADELSLMMTTSMIAAPAKDSSRPSNNLNDISACQRSCSANQLDAIVDILGVPSEVLSQRDFSKRLILMEEKSNLRGRNFHAGGWQNPRRKTTNEVRKFGGRLKEVEKLRPKIPTLEGCGKSKSCDEPTSSQTSPGLTRKELEVKRRSIYGRECKGRSEARTCNKCQTVAHQVHDIELNREIFDIPTTLTTTKPEMKAEEDCDEVEAGPEEDEIHVATVVVVAKEGDVNEDEEILKSEESAMVVNSLPEITVMKDDGRQKDRKKEEKTEGKSPRTRRRFDSVKNLLEKARQKLLLTKQFWSHHNNSHDPKSSKESKNVSSSKHPEVEANDITHVGDDVTGNHLRVPALTQIDPSVTQSSPSTPAELRKNIVRRNRSFSPVRSFLNSPLLRRRKKMSIESSEEDVEIAAGNVSVAGQPDLTGKDDFNDDEAETEATPPVGSRGYHNLETFQRKKLRQKLKKFTQPNSSSVPIPCPGNPSKREEEEVLTLLSSSLPNPLPQRAPYPSPPPAPQRVPHPPGGKSRINHSTAKSSSFSPFLGRKSRLFGAFPSTPNSTPFSTPFVKRRQLGTAGAGGGVDADHSSVARLNSFLPQHNQVYSLENEPLSFCGGPPAKSRRPRRRLVLHNKAPMWNEASQVYQLDFGGRVTQESAKNFQIEYKGKQVMQFGRIDNNAYTLDFQYPFTAVQAFAVALANVTQRLK